MSEIAHQNHSEKKAFLVNSSSLRDVRSFCRGVFEKLQIKPKEIVTRKADNRYTNNCNQD